MKSKRFLAWGMAVLMMAGLTGCGGNTETTAASGSTAAAPVTTEAAEAGSTKAETTAAEKTTAPSGGAASSGAEALPVDSAAFEAADAPSFQIILGHGTSETQLGGKNCAAFAKEVEARSNGKITCQVYPNGQLGSDAENYTSTQQGTIQMSWMATGSYVSYIPEVGILSMPMYFESADKCYELLLRGTAFRGALDQVFQDNGLVCIGISPTAFRTMTSSKKIETMEDFKGINIRTTDDQYQMKFWNDLGCNATPLAFSELYLALQQGLMDAEENPLDTVVNNNLGEVQKYVVTTNHVPFISTFMMNKAFFDSMPVDYQNLVINILDEIAADNMAHYDEINDSALNTLISQNGCEVCELSGDVLKAMRETGEPIWKSMQDELGEEISSAFNNTMQEIQ